MKLIDKIKKFGAGLLVGTSILTCASCSEADVDALINAKNDIVALLDDEAANITEPGRTYRVNDIERAIANVADAEGEENHVELIAKAKVNGNDTKIAFSIKGDAESVKALDAKSEQIYDTKEAEDLIEYLNLLHDFVEANISNCNVNTSYKQADNVKDLSLTKNDAIVSKVISHYATDGDAINRDKIYELLDKTKDAQYNNTISIDRANKTAYVYSSFNIHTFQIGVKINTEASYTEVEMIDLVAKFFNGETITDDLTIEIIPGSEVWIANYQQALWNNINKSTEKNIEVTEDNNEVTEENTDGISV